MLALCVLLYKPKYVAFLCFNAHHILLGTVCGQHTLWGLLLELLGSRGLMPRVLLHITHLMQHTLVWLFPGMKQECSV